MTYEQALQFWFGRINYEQRTPAPGDLKLDRMLALLELLGNPHEALPVIHIAGSKGKGSTAAMLAVVLRSAGYRTGLFTSPHLCQAEERVQIDGQPISPEDLGQVMDEVAAAVKVLDERQGAGHSHVTFFEIATAVGFVHFARRCAEAVVLEVGLGGRFDATNVCRPLVSLITSISFDHTQQLGNTLASIAREKAGIVKPGRPVISGVRDGEARAVITAICQERGCSLRTLGHDFHHVYAPGLVTADVERLPWVQVVTEQRAWPALHLRLFGEHQADNAALVVATVEELHREGFRIADEAVSQGLRGVHWPARLEVVRRRPLVVLDCAHNVASAEALLRALQISFHWPAGHASRPPERRLLFAGTRDKDVAGMLRVLAPWFHHAYLTCYGRNPRCVPPEKLAELLQDVAALPITVCATPRQAWECALDDAGPKDLICIAGSVFLAGELRPLLIGEDR
jgi:dihydrofolate synthase/folylpolyglutamate synthase